MRLFLDRVLGRRTNDIGLLGTKRRRAANEDVDIQDLDPFDSIVEEGGDVGVAAGLEHSTSTFVDCSVR